MEENGIGTAQNINQAIETYRELVTRSNYTPAMYTLGKLLITTSSDEEDHNSGISFLEQASRKQALKRAAGAIPAAVLVVGGHVCSPSFRPSSSR